MTILKVACIGVNDKHAFFFEQLLKVYKIQLKHDWHYMGNFEPEQVIDTMSSNVSDANILLIDVDNEYGKRAWYILQALIDEDKMVAVTNTPELINAVSVIQKPKLNWLASDGAIIVKLLNNCQA
jgi:hypothetical protein